MFLVWIESYTSQKMAFLKLLVPHIPRLCPLPKFGMLVKGNTVNGEHLALATNLLTCTSQNIRTSLLEIQPLLVSAAVSLYQAFSNKRPLRSLCLGCDPLQ
jgi:ABC-type cobalamin transport system permease subunit